MKDWKNILSRLKYWDERARRIARDLNSKGNSALAHDLDYYIYEAPGMEDHATISFEGKSWDMKKDDEAIDYFNKFYP